MYARFAGGKIERLRALSVTCPVKAETEIRALGAVSVDDSARWLASLANEVERDAVTRHHVGDDVLPTLAIHRGTIAFDALSGIARNAARDKQRERAVFWLAILRGREGAEVATDIMFNDKDTEVRQHAAFAVAKSQSPRPAADLMKLVTTDPSAGVREHAIFAMSQLPEEHATNALVAVAENASLARAERKRAVFWLSQSESSAAQAYLEKVLAAEASSRDASPR
jgi:HEAT repeat protein